MENGEIVRRVDDAFLAGRERGHFAGGAATGLVSEDHELIVVAEFPGRRSYRGERVELCWVYSPHKTPLTRASGTLTPS